MTCNVTGAVMTSSTD